MASMNPEGFSTPATLEALKHQHSWRSPNEASRTVLHELRQRFLDLAVFLDCKTPSSRERSLALTKLDEARMWASNAATLAGEIKEDITINIPL